MKNFVIGAIVGALVGVLVGYLVWGRQVADLQSRIAALESKLASVPAQPAVVPLATGNPHVAVIVLKGGFNEQCGATVNPEKIGNTRNQKVYWVVDYDDSQCQGGNWDIVLRFDNASDGTPWNGGDISVRRNGVTPFKIANNAPYKSFPYRVYYRRTGVGATEYPMTDPELEIEQ
jgi:hypothetical protein